MPLNEAGAPRSNLTKQQRQEALAAIYGLPPEPTSWEIEQIRARLFRDSEPENDKSRRTI